MYLINTRSLKLSEFQGENVPDYAILSHTWGEGEVSFEIFQNGTRQHLKGYEKIEGCCSVALRDGWQYVWIDTCCIEKRSSAELSEAINSMYRWYSEAQVCYAFLADLSLKGNCWVTNTDNEITNSRKFVESRWFTRGWTLQELLAPASVIFFDHDWIEIGTRSSLLVDVCTATGISEKHIAQPRIASVAQKFSWVLKR